MNLRGKRVTDERLRNLRLSSLQTLSLYNTSVTDDGVEVLADAVNLTQVHITSKLLTDRSMAILCSLPKLQSLLLDRVPLVTDAGIAELQQRSSLSELYLRGTQLTDRGIRFMTHLEGVWSLILDDTEITDRGVRLLAEMTQISLLSLERTRVSGRGLCDVTLGEKPDVYLDCCPVDDDAVTAFTKHLTELRRLSLNDTDVTDRCLPAISNLHLLGNLRLNNTAVTDRGVRLLHQHPTLQVLYLEGTQVTQGAVARLKGESPEELVVYYP